MKKYSETLFLPKTSFRIKGDAKRKEEEFLSLWDKSQLLEKRRDISGKSRPFVIHDGPPYANGHLHMGHALNKILKDVIGRFHYLYGWRVDYTPGWDCHGLPIEWMVELEYRKKKISKDDVPVVGFRENCRKFAAKWIELQKQEFKRLGILADWNKVYKTMDFASEAEIVGQLLKINRDGHLYESYRPVLWSIAEKTSLAEAEVEYKDINSRAMFVKFPIADNSASVLIWTTTPWTLLANRGLAYSGELSYGMYKHGNERLIFADRLFQDIKKVSKSEDWSRESDVKSLRHMKCRHPFYDSEGKNFDFSVPLLEADFVTAEKGTGIVHVAPAHGEDDFSLAQKTRFCEVEETVDEGGFYTVEGWKDVHIFKALPLVREVLLKNHRLLAEEDFHHSYPHSWRSGVPLIYRATKQLFFDLSLSEILKNSIEEVKKNIQFTPTSAKQRLASTLETRPDWLLSRQRYWGVPITLFIHKDTGQILCDSEIDKRIMEYVSKEGGDAWFIRPNEDFFGDRADAMDFRKMEDILDVWFDSSCSHLFVLKNSQADLYIEGSDQHRGWFQASLLMEIQRSGKSPYKGIVSHGFVLDEKGHKMSKSQGNVVTPEEVIQQYGADLIRVWVVSSDYTRDLRVGQSMLKAQAEILHKFRNTLRFILGNLCQASPDLPDLTDKNDLKDTCFVDRWILQRLFEVNRELKEAFSKYDLHRCYIILHELCDKDLSSLYFDILKDTLYCDSEGNQRRKYAVAVLHQVFHFLVHWLSPIIPFTAEEASLEFSSSQFGKKYGYESVHHLHGIEVPKIWQDATHQGQIVFSIRRVVNGCLEMARKQGIIGSSNEAFPKVFLADSGWYDAVKDLNMKEICLVSGIEFIHGNPEKESFQIQDIEGVGVLFRKFEGTKCPRCWMYHSGEMLCKRCEAVLR